MNRSAASRYQQNDVFSMSPERRVVFLYGQTLASLRQAARHIERKEIEARAACLIRAREILGELLTTLDFDNGGKIAKNLAGLYAWFIDELIQVDVHQDGARLARVITPLADLHSAWAQAAESMLEPTASAAAE
ncbi:MAG: flagellar export chaperone FliS [Gemmatimonadota bacterium]